MDSSVIEINSPKALSLIDFSSRFTAAFNASAAMAWVNYGSSEPGQPSRELCEQTASGSPGTRNAGKWRSQTNQSSRHSRRDSAASPWSNRKSQFPSWSNPGRPLRGSTSCSPEPRGSRSSSAAAQIRWVRRGTTGTKCPGWPTRWRDDTCGTWWHIRSSYTNWGE